jgi:hypothetical protein
MLLLVVGGLGVVGGGSCVVGFLSEGKRFAQE